MNLQLSLKTQWFEMTKAGIKTEDYREITPYWCKRFINGKFSEQYTVEEFCETLKTSRDASNLMRLYQKPFTTNIMTLGYPSKTDTNRILKFKHEGIKISTGNPEWGAEPNKLYFVVKHGEVVK